METIQYDDFAKVVMVVGTVLSVDLIPDADKLLRLMVNVGGTEPRQILSGIREYLEDPQSLVGKQFPFVINLVPRTLRGLESQGMILAASQDDTLAFFSPSTVVPPGTRLK